MNLDVLQHLEELFTAADEEGTGHLSMEAFVTAFQGG